MKIKARSKFLDLRNNFSARQLYSIIGFVFVLCLFAVLLFVWIRDLLISITFLFCAIVGYFIFTQPAQEIMIEIDEFGLKINDFEFKSTDIISWAVVDLGDVLEIVIKTKNYANPFVYFYLPDESRDTNEFIAAMRNQLFYDAQMPNENTIHQILRILNLR